MIPGKFVELLTYIISASFHVTNNKNILFLKIFWLWTWLWIFWFCVVREAEILCKNSEDGQKVHKQPPELFCQKGALRNFSKFTGKHLYHSLFFNKIAGLRYATLLKKRLWQRCFPVNFAKFLRTPFLTITSGGCFLRPNDRRSKSQKCIIPQKVSVFESFQQQ